MFKLSPRQWLAVGLLLISLGLAVRALAPGWAGSDAGDVAIGLILGAGFGIELMAVIKLRRTR